MKRNDERTPCRFPLVLDVESRASLVSTDSMWMSQDPRMGWAEFCAWWAQIFTIYSITTPHSHNLINNLINLNLAYPTNNHRNLQPKVLCELVQFSKTIKMSPTTRNKNRVKPPTYPREENTIHQATGTSPQLSSQPVRGTS